MADTWKRVKILIVDDDELLAAVLVRTLREHETAAVLDPVSAIDVARRADEALVPFELVLCDMMLGAMSGRQVLAELRALRTLPSFVLMSGHDDTLEGAVEGGEVDGVLVKPFGAAELRSVIASFDRGRRRARLRSV